MEGPVPPPVSVRAEMEERRIQLQAGKAQLPICPQRKVGSETRKPPRQPSQKSIVESPHVGSRLSGQGQRSEEHTSELQSLMRISYAVFCLKKKKNEKIHRK